MKRTIIYFFVLGLGVFFFGERYCTCSLSFIIVGLTIICSDHSLYSFRKTTMQKNIYLIFFMYEVFCF